MPTSIHAPEPAASPGMGYDPTFLGPWIAVPSLPANLAEDAVLVEGSPVIDYTHFSLTLSRSRRLARWVGWNIDGSSMKLLDRSGTSFRKDPRLPAEAQVGNELYSNNRLDRGHLARRGALTWGELNEAEQANYDSFFYTNITPQMEDFNQSRQNGIWGNLENSLYEDVTVDKLRVSVFAGPVFRPTDQVYRNVQLPSEYWKLILFRHNSKLTARAFLLTQNLDQLQVLLMLDEFRVYQITVNELEERTTLEFPSVVHEADDLVLAQTATREPLNAISQITW